MTTSPPSPATVPSGKYIDADDSLAQSPPTLRGLARLANNLNSFNSQELLDFINNHPSAFDCRIIEARHYKDSGPTPHEFIILTLHLWPRTDTNQDLVCGLRFDRRAWMGESSFTQSLQMVKVGSSSMNALDVINGIQLVAGNAVAKLPKSSARLITSHPWSAPRVSQDNAVTLSELANMVQPIYEVLGEYDMYDSNCWALARLVLFFSTRSLIKVLFDKTSSHSLGLVSKSKITSNILRVHHASQNYTLVCIAEKGRKDKPLAMALYSLKPTRPIKIQVNSTDLEQLNKLLEEKSMKNTF